MGADNVPVDPAVPWGPSNIHDTKICCRFFLLIEGSILERSLRIREQIRWKLQGGYQVARVQEGVGGGVFLCLSLDEISVRKLTIQIQVLRVFPHFFQTNDRTTAEITAPFLARFLQLITDESYRLKPESYNSLCHGRTNKINFHTPRISYLWKYWQTRKSL